MMKRRVCKSDAILLATLVSVLVSNPASANIISDGSFETPVVTSGSFTSFNNGTTIPGTSWSVVGPLNTNVAIVSGSFSQNGVSFPAQDGSQWLDLTGTTNLAEGVSQTVATTVGDQYQLSYWIGNTTGGTIFGTTSTVNVSLNGTPAFSNTNATSSPTTQNWEQFSHTFVATGTSTTLAFLNGDPVSDNNNGLDNIVLTDLGRAPVPGPIAGAGLPGAIFGALGLIWFARQRQQRVRSR
jgi:hypothetical protein